MRANHAVQCNGFTASLNANFSECFGQPYILYLGTSERDKAKVGGSDPRYCLLYQVRNSDEWSKYVAFSVYWCCGCTMYLEE